MSLRERFRKKVEETEQRKKMIKIRRRLEAEERKEADAQMLKGIFPRVKDVFKEFAEALPPEWKNETQKYTLRKQKEGTGVFWVERGASTIAVEIRGRLVPSETPSIEVRRYNDRGGFSVKFLQKYAPKKAYLYSRGTIISEVKICIPVGDFTKEKLAQILMDFYDAT